MSGDLLIRNAMVKIHQNAERRREVLSRLAVGDALVSPTHLQRLEREGEDLWAEYRKLKAGNTPRYRQRKTQVKKRLPKPEAKPATSPIDTSHPKRRVWGFRRKK